MMASGGVNLNKSILDYLLANKVVGRMPGLFCLRTEFIQSANEKVGDTRAPLPAAPAGAGRSGSQGCAFSNVYHYMMCYTFGGPQMCIYCSFKTSEIQN